MERTTLITGGAGFIGSHLCERLVAQGDNVLCVDNFYTGTRANLRHLQGEPNFELLRHDIWLPLYVEAHRIFNLACPASPVHYQQQAVSTVKTAVLGAINTLGIARRRGARILQASTSEVYGDAQVHPQPEAYWGHVNPIGPRACYDEGKRCAETLFFDYHRQYGVDIRIARIFNTYGPRMHPEDGRVVSNFICQALRGEPITVYGDGRQSRSFCYVDDLVDGLLRLMETDGMSGPVNLGNPHECTILELAEKVIQLTDSSSRILFGPLPADDPCRRQPDITVASTALGWRPRVSLEDGLAATVAYFQELLAAGDRRAALHRSGASVGSVS